MRDEHGSAALIKTARNLIARGKLTDAETILAGLVVEGNDDEACVAYADFCRDQQRYSQAEKLDKQASEIRERHRTLISAKENEMDKIKFHDGQRLRCIFWPDSNSHVEVDVESRQYLSITVVMEDGQMGLVPWAVVIDKYGKSVKYNLAHAEGVELLEDES